MDRCKALREDPAVQRDRAAALRPEHADMATKPVAQPRPPAVIVNNSDDEMELNVGNFDLVTRSEKHQTRQSST